MSASIAPAATAPVLPRPALVPFDPARVSFAEELERGAFLSFPRGTVALPPESELRFLREELGSRIRLDGSSAFHGIAFHNVSWHPEDGGHVTGLRGNRAFKSRVRGALESFHGACKTALECALPEYRGRMRSGKVNFRPLEERGRDSRPRSSNERPHIDAMVCGPAHGARLLRFFTNVHPERPRVWKSHGLFPEILVEFGRAAGLEPGRVRLVPSPPERLFIGALERLARAGVPGARLIGTSPYDRAMKRLHNHLKMDQAFQGERSRETRFELPPYSSWAVFTDTVSHAIVEGQYALVATFFVPVDACAVPALAPWNLLGGANGR